MHVVRNPVSLRKLVALDERVHQARARLQRTTEADPSLERRVQTLLRLTKDRDRAMSGDDPFFPPAA
ncbi:MAG TPA: hypothetical protein VKU19_24045 [Bryobacteraceae bacterium]|nr:hypothetical protein [Bryobacteraceae bacterium]